MCKELMRKKIDDLLDEADEQTLESFYWFLVMEVDE